MYRHFQNKASDSFYKHVMSGTHLQDILGHTVNGTTYVGLRARTTGAPQNHWWVEKNPDIYCFLFLFSWKWNYDAKWYVVRFGPAGDPRGAGIGTPEAIKLVWSCHREVIYDHGPVPNNWQIPPSTWVNSIIILTWPCVLSRFWFLKRKLNIIKLHSTLRNQVCLLGLWSPIRSGQTLIRTNRCRLLPF